jgi:hypothetical protein
LKINWKNKVPVGFFLSIPRKAFGLAVLPIWTGMYSKKDGLSSDKSSWQKPKKAASE